MAATWDAAPGLLGKTIEVMVQGRTNKPPIRVNVQDVCNDSDCNGCCRTNTGNGKYPLIDLKKWPAVDLLGFDPSSATFDINNVQKPTSVGLRLGAPEGSVMPLCYKVVA